MAMEEAQDLARAYFGIHRGHQLLIRDRSLRHMALSIAGPKADPERPESLRLKGKPIVLALSRGRYRGGRHRTAGLGARGTIPGMSSPVNCARSAMRWPRISSLIAGRVAMPKIDIAAVPERKGSGYPPPFDAPCADRVRQRLCNAGGLPDFGVHLMPLPPGNWSSQRH